MSCAFVAVALALQGCGSSAGSTTFTTTTTATGTTITTTRTTTSTTKPEEMVLQDFQSDTGIAFTKLMHKTWEKGPGKGGFMNQDAAVFFKKWNGNPQKHSTMQAVTITNSKKWMWAFHGALWGYSSWGLIFNLREEAKYWKYISTNAACKGLGAPLMAQCGDCKSHCCMQYSGSGLVGDSLSFADWTAKKNVIVRQSGFRSACPTIPNGGTGHEDPGRHGWNEFSSNGLSYDAVTGILNDLTGEGGQAPIGESPPKEQDVCKFLAQINAEREAVYDSSWPIFDYKVQHASSSLTLRGYLHCKAFNQSSAIDLVI